MKKVFTLMTLLVAMVTGAWAETETFSMATKWTSTTATQNGITVTFDDPLSNAQKGYFKFTKGHTMTISSTVGNITALTFTSDSEKYGKSNGTTVNTGTLTGAGTANISWSGDAAEIVFTNDASKGGDWRVASITVTYTSGPATKPIITKQPQNVEYTLGTDVYPDMSVEATASAGTLSYLWEMRLTGEENFWDITDFVSSATAATLLGSEFITAVGITEPTVFYIRCRVEDSNGWVYTNVVTLTVKAPIVPEAPTITIAADNERTVSLKGSSNIKLVATVTGAPDPTIQWYSKEGEMITAVAGATSKEFSPATTGYGTFTYFAKATNASGTADSDPITVMVKPALQSVKFTNGAYGAITEPTALPAEGEPMGKIEVPFINGATAPEVDEASWKAFSDTEATISHAENKITVTSGTNTAVYEYQLIPVEPITTTTDIAKTNFTEVPAWVYNPYGYSWGEATKDQKGVRFAKVLDEANNMRVAKGYTRQYYFVGPAKSLTLTASPCATRKVNVYVNGTSFKADTDNNAIGAITLSETGANLVMIESNQTGGDGGFSAYAIVAADPTGISDVKADAAAAAKKYVKNGRLVIETARGTFNAAGVEVK